eukprot:UC1_evm1s159
MVVTTPSPVCSNSRRVFATSRGVVMAAAAPPAAEPHSERAQPGTASALPQCEAAALFAS